MVKPKHLKIGIRFSWVGGFSPATHEMSCASPLKPIAGAVSRPLRRSCAADFKNQRILLKRDDYNMDGPAEGKTAGPLFCAGRRKFFVIMARPNRLNPH